MSVKNLYISSMEPCKTNTAISMGLIEILKSKEKNIAFFRPIALSKDADKEVLFAIENYGLDMKPKDAIGFSIQEVRTAIAENKLNEIIQGIINKYKALENRYDFIICKGIERSFLPSLDFDINLEIAKNINAPIFNVIRGKNYNGVELFNEISIRANSIKKADCSHLATFITGVCEDSFQNAENLNSFAPVYFLQKSCSITKNDASETCEENGEQILLKIQEVLSQIDAKEIINCIYAANPTCMTPIMFETNLFEMARKNRKKIVLPESSDERILRASEVIMQKNVADIILLGNTDEINKKASALGIDISKAQIIEPQKSPLLDKYAEQFFELRKSKGITIEAAKSSIENLNYFGTMMVYNGDADGMVSGAIHTTSDTVRPALQIVKTKPGISIISSIFFMCLDTKVLVYGDCAINITPSAAELAEIAITSADTVVGFGIEPRVAMLSYSTGNSGEGPEVEKVKEAVKIVKEKRPDIMVEGPIQYDAAIDSTVAKLKLPNSKVAGQANVFIFPDLNTGNNTYKAVQRSANAVAVGPVLQGLKKPINDLSRGCLIADIVNTVAITAIQATK